MKQPTLFCVFFRFADHFLLIFCYRVQNCHKRLNIGPPCILFICHTSISQVIYVFTSLVLCVAAHIDVQKSLIILLRTRFWPPRCPLSKEMFIPAWQRSECIGVLTGDLKNTCHYFSLPLACGENQINAFHWEEFPANPMCPHANPVFGIIQAA